jgi:hypothetical protein
MYTTFFQSTRVRIAIVFSLIAFNFLIFVLPYYVNDYAAPVGWDTAWYVRNMRVIADRGLLTLFEKTHEINLYVIFGYLISSIFHISFATTEKFLPIIVGISFPLVNFQIVRRFSKSWTHSLLAIGLSIIDFNIIRMVTDLHRNLLCFILVEIALFLVLPDLLDKVSKKKTGVLIILLVLAGLSQMETFAVVMLTLFFLFVFYVWQQSYHKAKILLFGTIVSFSLVILLEYPFLPTFLTEHLVFSSMIEFSYERFVAQPWSYLLSLGSGLIPFYIAGLHTSLSTGIRSREGHVPFIVPLWNITVIACSFIPWLGIKIPGYRFLLLGTVPLLSIVGFSKLFAEKSLKLKRLVILIMLSALVITVQIVNFSVHYKPWISNSEYEKLTWIDNYKQSDPCIFVLYFDQAEYTYHVADLYRNWVLGLVGARTDVYFGNVEYLLDPQPGPTPSESHYVNMTSWNFWNSMENFTINGTSVYLIEDWYEITPYPAYLKQVDDGVYQVEIDQN